MGTPQFAVEGLQKILSSNHEIVAVVTTPDKPAGRGYQLQESAVKKAAIELGIPVLQPEKLKSKSFIQKLKKFEADLFVVVAFRKLPEIVWQIPKKGTFNLHASLLPQYRGAAPINWAIINGEQITGVTTFFINEKIDTGDILLSKSVEILNTDNLGDLHDKLMKIGGELIIETINGIEKNTITPQNQLNTVNNLKDAPKIFSETCKIDWQKSAHEIYNLIRGLSPYPGAFLLADENGKTLNIKVFSAEILPDDLNQPFETDDKTFWKIKTNKGSLNLLELQFPGKKRLSIKEILQGKKVSNLKIIM
jgi:methionyl-tRNA formyltransferase